MGATRLRHEARRTHADLYGEIDRASALLVIGGDIDPVVPATMSQQLYQAAQQPKRLWIVPGAVHGNYLNAAPHEYPQRLVEFFSRELSAEPMQAR